MPYVHGVDSFIFNRTYNTVRQQLHGAAATQQASPNIDFTLQLRCNRDCEQATNIQRTPHNGIV